MRVWGTYGFIIAQIILAFQFLFLEDIRWMFVNWFISNMFLVITTFRMEALPSGLKRGELFKGLKLLLEPSFGIFCAGCVMQRIAMTGYYTFFSLYIVGLGLPFRVAALAWCIGPISEILVIQYGDRLVNYIGVKGCYAGPWRQRQHVC